MKTIIIIAFSMLWFSLASAQSVSTEQNAKVQVSLQGSKSAKTSDITVKRNGKVRISSKGIKLTIKKNGKVRASSKNAKFQMTIPKDKMPKITVNNSVRR